MTLRRRHPDVGDDEFASFVADVRASVPSAPHEETAQRHLAAMRAAAEEGAKSIGADASGPATERNFRGAGAEMDRAGRRRSAGPLRPDGRRRPRPSRRPALRLGAALAGALLAFGGTSTVLAAVGVELPEVVRAPFDAVGIDLPNQPDDDEATAPRPAAPAGGEREPGRSGDAPAGGADRGRSGEPGRGRAGDDDRDRPGRRRGQGRDRDRGRSGDAPGRRSDESRNRSGEPPGSRSDEAPGRRNGGGAGAKPGNRGNAQRRGSGRPANPAPRRSAGRGAGPRRPVKPNPSRDRAPKRTPPPAPTPEPEPFPAEPAPEPGTATSP